MENQQTKAELLSEVFSEHNPVKFMTLMAHHLGKLMIEANAGELTYGVDVTINGERVRVESSFELSPPLEGK